MDTEPVKFDIVLVFGKPSAKQQNGGGDDDDADGTETDAEESDVDTEDPETWDCRHCSKKYHLRSELLRHVRTFHPKGSSSKSEHAPTKSSGTKATASRSGEKQSTAASNECLNCGKIINQNASFFRHLKSCVARLRGTKAHNGFVCCHCGRSDFKGADRLHQHKKHEHPVIEDSPHTCGCCSNVFPCKKRFLDHLSACAMGHFVEHTGKSFECPHCSETFPSCGSFHRHKLEKHTSHGIILGNVSHSRPHCSKAGEGSFQCLNCGKIFKLKRYSASHLKACVVRLDYVEAHHGWICCHCGRSDFGNSRQLSYHKKSQHRLTKHLPHACGYCGENFIKRTNFLLHLSLCVIQGK